MTSCTMLFLSFFLAERNNVFFLFFPHLFSLNVRAETSIQSYSFSEMKLGWEFFEELSLPKNTYILIMLPHKNESDQNIHKVPIVAWEISSADFANRFFWRDSVLCRDTYWQRCTFWKFVLSSNSEFK